MRKIHSVDCVWNYARNVQENDKNFSEECDGEECNYICSESPLQYINKNSKFGNTNIQKTILIITIIIYYIPKKNKKKLFTN